MDSVFEEHKQRHTKRITFSVLDADFGIHCSSVYEFAFAITPSHAARAMQPRLSVMPKDFVAF